MEKNKSANLLSGITVPQMHFFRKQKSLLKLIDSEAGQNK
jgi:hypothetical protein